LKKLNSKLGFSVIPVAFLLTIIILNSNITFIAGYLRSDPIMDVTYLLDGVYQGSGDYEPSVDIMSVEINTTHAIMSLRESPNLTEPYLYYIWIYWTDVVDEHQDDVNKTLCFLQDAFSFAQTYLYNSSGSMVFNYMNTNVEINDKQICFPLPLEATSAYPNPKTVWAKAFYTNPQGTEDPPDPMIDYIDYFPNSTNPYETSSVNASLFGLVLVPAIIFIRKRIKKK